MRVTCHKAKQQLVFPVSLVIKTQNILMLDSITASARPKTDGSNQHRISSVDQAGVGVGGNLAWGLTLAYASYVSGHASGTQLHRVTNRLMTQTTRP